MSTILGILKGSGPALQLVRSLLKTGTPASDVLDQVRAAGYNVIPQTLNQAIDYLTQVVTPADLALSSLGDSVLPNLASIPLTLTKTLRNFSYRVKVTGRSQFTNQLQDQYISISTNSLLTKEQAVDAAQSMVLGSANYGGMLGASGEVESIAQNSSGLVNTDTILPGTLSFGELPNAGEITSLSANRNYLKTVAQGPVSPLVFTQPAPFIPFGYDSLDEYYRDIS